MGAKAPWRSNPSGATKTMRTQAAEKVTQWITLNPAVCPRGSDAPSLKIPLGAGLSVTLRAPFFAPLPAPLLPFMVKKIFLGLLTAAVIFQFIRPEKNLSTGPSPMDFLVLHPAPAEVKNLLTVGCYDCHSDHTRYPWYAEIQPLGWWFAQHVRDGQRDLNLSAFGELTKKRTATKLEEMVDVIGRRAMPLPSYTLAHRDARFTDAQIKQLTTWLEALRDKIAPDE